MPVNEPYGYFDDEAREYVITRPDTPKSWMNYLGSRLYGGIVTQNAGGYSFYRSGGAGRVLRMRFNGVPVDEPGRFVYLRDDAGSAISEPGDFWSASWQPVGKPLGDGAGQQAARVRHGLGYSIFESAYAGIASELTIFVPRGQAFEYWRTRVTNTGTEPRTISVFSYAELANDWHYRQDLENLQYSQFTVMGRYRDGLIHRSNRTRTETDHLWFALVGAPVASFDTDRDRFLGRYRTQSAPRAVQDGSCTGSETTGDNACASLHARLELAPGETREVTYLLGIGHPDESWNGLPAGREIVGEFGRPERVEAELEAIREEWAGHLAPLQVSTPDPDLDSMINVWHAYQTHMTFNWSRGVSLVEAGDRDGLGYRDTVQDMLAVTHSIPDAVRERLDLILTGQTAEGGAMPLVKPLTHRPGHERTPTVEEYRSDDTLWLPLTVANFVYETGDLAYLDTVLPYADHGSATVFEHLRQALQFSIDHSGRNGLVQGLAADWNDCVNLGTEGESVFTTFLFYLGLRIVEDLAALSGREDDAAWAREQRGTVKKAIDTSAWDGAWFVRGISATGQPLGSVSNREGSLYLESNVWAVISGAASSEQAVSAMDAVGARLATEHGVALCDPPHTEPIEGVGLSLLVYPPGHKENGGIFCHSNSWAIVAEAVLGRGARAYDYYRSYLPSRFGASAELAEAHQAEPYVYAQFAHGPASPRFGQARNSWLTGTASWTYIAVTQHLLGVRPAPEGLLVDPCVPASWDGFSVRRRYRGADIVIKVENPTHVESGVAAASVQTRDGRHRDVVIEDPRRMVVPAEWLEDGAEVLVTLG